MQVALKAATLLQPRSSPCRADLEPLPLNPIGPCPEARGASTLLQGSALPGLRKHFILPQMFALGGAPSKLPSTALRGQYPSLLCACFGPGCHDLP